MSDNDGLAGNSSSNGGGVINDGGAVGAGHTTLSGAVEQADKAIRDSAASVVGFSDIDWNLFDHRFRSLLDVFHPLDISSLNLRLDQLQPGIFCVSCLLNSRHLRVCEDLRMPGAFDPAKAENGDSQEGGGPSFDEEALRRE